jgi:hypothetical protein
VTVPKTTAAAGLDDDFFFVAALEAATGPAITSAESTATARILRCMAWLLCRG